jgi:c(7)-type cytochrome triheme protein
MKRLFFVLFLILIFAGITLAQVGVKKKRPLPQEYGRSIISNHSEKAGMAPVVFDHWLHRAKFTCRLCHVDIAFAMKTGGTDIKAVDNMKGFYCGACHNGKMEHGERKVFEACSKKITQEDAKRCDRCHSFGKIGKKEYDFAEFTAKFPKERLGNGIDWEKAEVDGYIKPVDFIEGVSTKRTSFIIQKDFALAAKVEGLPDIIFSHKKHTAWNGCEVCHPEIFLGVKKGATKYSMIEIFEGKFCGICHRTVAFPMTDCQRCHEKPVQ